MLHFRIAPIATSCAHIYIIICYIQNRPEGGWEEPNELDLFEQHRFQKVTLGTRVLRSDVAVVSLLALANEVCSKEIVSAPAANDK